MENKNLILIKFVEEDKTFEMDISNPNFNLYVSFVIENRLKVVEGNVNISSSDDHDFDIESFTKILIDAYNKYIDEIESFYSNIVNSVETYYSDESISDELITHIAEKYGYTKVVSKDE